LLCIAIHGCVPRDPAAIAASADAAAGGGVFRWLAAYDPSALVVVGVDPTIARAVAPDARVLVEPDVKSGCRRALAGHALLAARASHGSAARAVAEDCGYALFHDDRTLVVAPR
jgi:hypothetical protein